MKNNAWSKMLGNLDKIKDIDMDDVRDAISNKIAEIKQSIAELDKEKILEIAKEISEGLARNATAGRINGEVVDLRFEVNEDCKLEILTFTHSLNCSSVSLGSF